MTSTGPIEGHVLAQRYRLVSRLGQGGMGTVWRAEHVSLGSPVAVKLMDLASSEDALARFRREAKAAASLQSPHVVQIIDYGVDGATPYIAMELLDGESLAQRLERVGVLSPAETGRMLTHVARALTKAHERGIVHRDLKPENIFVVRNEDDELYKVLDFGIAKAIRHELGGTSGSTTATGVLIGTPFYMSPEQARGTKAVGTPSDLWSLGVIAFECLTGKRPFESSALGDLLLQICTNAPPAPSSFGCSLAGFNAWFARACAREPDNRFSSAREMAEAFRQLVQPGALDGRTSDRNNAENPSSLESLRPRVVARTAPGVAHTMGDGTNPRRPSRAARYALIAAVPILLTAIVVGAFALRRPDTPEPATTLQAESSSAKSASPASVATSEPSSGAALADAGADSGPVNIDTLPLVAADAGSGAASPPAGVKGGARPAPKQVQDPPKPAAPTSAGVAPATKSPNWGF